MFYISQVGENDCGFACLKILLAEINKNKDYLYLPNPKDDEPYSYQELIRLGKSHGLELEGIKVDSGLELKNNDVWPIIASIEIEGNKHAVVIKGIRLDKVEIYDPMLGKRSIAFKKFIEMWDLTLLIIKKNKPLEEEFTAYNFLTLKDHLLLIFIQVISTVFLLLAMYFFNAPEQIMALIFLIVFIILQVILKSNSISLMKKLDTIFMDYLNNDNIKHTNLLKAYEEYKKYELTSVMGAITSLAISIILIALTLINGIIDIIIVLFCLAVSLFQVGILTPYLDKKTFEIGLKEGKLTRSKTVLEYQDLLEDIHHHSYHLGRKIMIGKYLSYFIIILGVFIVSRITNNNSLAFVLFYSCLGIYLSKEMNNALNIENALNKKRKAKVILINVLNSKSKVDK